MTTESAATRADKIDAAVQQNYEDTICACGHGHDATHGPDGYCYALDCGCEDDGVNICQARQGNGLTALRCQKVAPHTGMHVNSHDGGVNIWEYR